MNDTPREPRSDDELVRVARSDPDGSAARAAASELLGRYQSRAYVWCFRLVRDHDTALDLAQDSMISAYRALPGFESRARFSSWLFSIVRNRCLSALRPKSLTRDDDADPDELLDVARNPEAQLEARQQEEAVEALIREHLDADEQDAIWLRCVEHLPVDEITRMLNVKTASGARGLLQSARRKLRAALERRGDESGGTLR